VAASALETGLGAIADLRGHRLVFVDGHFASELSSRELPAGVSVTPLAMALENDAEAFEGANAFTHGGNESVIALNTAFATDGAVIDVADNAVVPQPLVIVHVRSGDTARYTTTRHVATIGASAKVTLVEATLALRGDAETAGQLNSATRLHIGDGAKVTHVGINIDAEAIHLGNWDATLGKETVYRPFFFSASPTLARNNLFVTFDGEGTALDASGCFLARGHAHIDNTLFIDHAVPECESRELFKGVLDDRARGIFQGKVVVRQIAQKTDGKQMAQALMLSPTCEFDSKPELEIYADDVVCGHGSTCAEIDPDLVFYLRARGIPEDTARALLMESFVGEAIEQIEDDAVADAVMKIAADWLAARAV
ncbi:MAG: Fe-S cluster assembly protein SufD, partial [Pseudomonadota bacterium]